ncbi:MAG: hypothetical protein O3B08_01675, partial [Proteobacteria bacterium]|nr:hypothetical protein [Pseudomonadota bacterium]
PPPPPPPPPQPAVTAVNPPDDDDDEGGPQATINGAAIKQTITTVATDTITFSFEFVYGDVSPAAFPDYGFISINGAVTLLNSPGQSAGPQSFSQSVGAGTLNIGFGSMNAGDGVVASFLSIEDFQVGGVSFDSWTALPTALFEPAFAVDTVRLSAGSGDGEATASIESFLGLASGTLGSVAFGGGFSFGSSPGFFFEPEDFAFTGSSVALFELGGHIPGVHDGFDRMEVAGTLTLDGVLDVTEAAST